jgi:hypothetical protein
MNTANTSFGASFSEAFFDFFSWPIYELSINRTATGLLAPMKWELTVAHWHLPYSISTPAMAALGTEIWVLG